MVSSCHSHTAFIPTHSYVCCARALVLVSVGVPGACVLALLSSRYPAFNSHLNYHALTLVQLHTFHDVCYRVQACRA